MEHATVLCEFANHYGTPRPPRAARPARSPARPAAAQLPHIRPAPAEVAEMSVRARLVLRLVEQLRAREDRDRDRARQRERQRAWDAEEADPDAGAGAPDDAKDPAARSVAEKDMALIRSKRGAAGAPPAPGGAKAKYRKRSVSPPSLRRVCVCADAACGSARRRRASATPATSARRPSGAAGRTARAPCATRAACVSPARAPAPSPA